MPFYDGNLMVFKCELEWHHKTFDQINFAINDDHADKH